MSGLIQTYEFMSVKLLCELIFTKPKFIFEFTLWIHTYELGSIQIHRYEFNVSPFEFIFELQNAFTWIHNYELSNMPLYIWIHVFIFMNSCHKNSWQMWIRKLWIHAYESYTSLYIYEFILFKISDNRHQYKKLPNHFHAWNFEPSVKICVMSIRIPISRAKARAHVCCYQHSLMSSIEHTVTSINNNN